MHDHQRNHLPVSKYAGTHRTRPNGYMVRASTLSPWYVSVVLVAVDATQLRAHVGDGVGTRRREED